MNEVLEELKDMVNYCCAASNDTQSFMYRLAAKLDVPENDSHMKHLVRDVIQKIITEKHELNRSEREAIMDSYEKQGFDEGSEDYNAWHFFDANWDKIHIGDCFKITDDPDGKIYCVIALGPKKIMYYKATPGEYGWVSPAEIEKIEDMYPNEDKELHDLEAGLMDVIKNPDKYDDHITVAECILDDIVKHCKSV